jgi:hypothetical protein
MTFTFAPSLATNLALVRFHIGDTNPDGHYLEDETINYFVTTYDVATAVIRCIQYIITQLSQPDFRLDWLTVSNQQAREGYEKLLKSKATELGISLSGVTASSTISLPYRADSYQDSDDSVHDGTP